MDIRQNCGAYFFIAFCHEVSGGLMDSKSEKHHMDLQNYWYFFPLLAGMTAESLVYCIKQEKAKRYSRDSSPEWFASELQCLPSK